MSVIQPQDTCTAEQHVWRFQGSLYPALYACCRCGELTFLQGLETNRPFELVLKLEALQ